MPWTAPPPPSRAHEPLSTPERCPGPWPSCLPSCVCRRRCRKTGPRATGFEETVLGFCEFFTLAGGSPRREESPGRPAEWRGAWRGEWRGAWRGGASARAPRGGRHFLSAARQPCQLSRPWGPRPPCPSGWDGGGGSRGFLVRGCLPGPHRHLKGQGSQAPRGGGVALWPVPSAARNLTGRRAAPCPAGSRPSRSHAGSQPLLRAGAGERCTQLGGQSLNLKHWRAARSDARP